MAKKKNILSGNNRLFLIGGVGGTAVAVLIAVFVFGVGLDFVNPLFQEPTPLTSQEIQEKVQVVIEIENIFCGGGTSDMIPVLVPFEGEVLNEESIAFLELALQEFGEFCVPLNEDIIPDEVDEETKKIEDEIIDPVPIVNPFVPTPDPFMNQTIVFSEAPVIVQICDELNLDCGSTSFVLSTKVTKIDSAGEVEVVEGRFGFEQLALFVEDVSDKDYATGRLVIELKIIGEPNTAISGKVDILGRTGQAQIGLLIPNLLIFEEAGFPFPTTLTGDLELQVEETTNADGEATVFFIGPTGALSPDFTFEFANNLFNREFPDEAITPLVLHLDFLNISDGTNDFSIRNVDLFTMDILRDDQKILIVNEEGITERVYPSDSRIIITTLTNDAIGNQCLIGTYLREACPTSEECSGRVSAGCLTDNSCTIRSPCLSGDPPNRVLAGTATSPTLSGINLLDSEGRLVATALGGTGIVFDELLTRNANYTIQITSPPISTGDLAFGKSQETQSYTCQKDATAKQQVTIVKKELRFGTTMNFFNNYYYYLTTNGIIEGATQCNFP